MNIYLVERTDDWGYNEYDSVVVCEKTPKKAKEFCEQYFSKENATCKLIGLATNRQKAGEILSSFNAA